MGGGVVVKATPQQLYPLGGFLDKGYFYVGAPAQNLLKQQYFPINCRVCTFNDYVSGLQYCAGGKIETNEMGRACGVYGGG
jgi:hypothetical protein